MMTVTMTVMMIMTVTEPMMMTILSSGRNSPCLITRVALGHWPEPVSHKNTHHDPCRQHHRQVLSPTTEITIMNMDFI